MAQVAEVLRKILCERRKYGKFFRITGETAASGIDTQLFCERETFEKTF